MKKSIILVLIMFALVSCQEQGSKTDMSDQDSAHENETEGLNFADIIGDTLRYDLGDPVFDIVITSDTTLYWKSWNPNYGTEDHEEIIIIPISEHENMVSYIERSGPGVCWYNDYERGITTVSVFVGEDMMTFSGTVKRKHQKE